MKITQFAWVLFALGAFGLFMYSHQRTQREHTVTQRRDQRAHVHQESVAAFREEVQAFAEQRQRYQTYHTRILQTVANVDPEGQELLQFYQERFDYLHVLPNGQTFGRNEAVAGDKLRLVVMARDQREARGIMNEAGWLYDPGTRLLVTPDPESYTDIWAAVVFAHELSHARRYDVELNHQVTNLPGDQYFLEEVRAHQLETRLLDRLTGGQYLTRINTWIDSQGPTITEGCMIGYPSSLGEAMRGLFPNPKTSDELSLRDAAFLMTVNEVIVQRVNGGDTFLVSCYRQAVEWYQQH